MGEAFGRYILGDFEATLAKKDDQKDRFLKAMQHLERAEELFHLIGNRLMRKSALTLLGYTYTQAHPQMNTKEDANKLSEYIRRQEEIVP